MTLREQLLSASERFCADRGISEARLAVLVVNDGKFFKRVRAGGEFTTATFEKFQAYFAQAERPSDAA